MNITGIEFLDVRINNIQDDIMSLNVIYNVIGDNRVAVGKNRIEIGLNGVTRDLVKAFLDEVRKAIETNDGIAKHESYDDLETPEQRKKILQEKHDRHWKKPKISLPKEVQDVIKEDKDK